MSATSEAPADWAGAPRDVDGVPHGQPVLDRLVALLELERIEDDIFRGFSPPESPERVFGGQVAAQALVAAARTVDPQRKVHSLHSYFIRPGDTRIPIVYEVDRIRDGRSFTTRRVVAVQRGKAIFSLSASFQRPEPGVEHSDPMPDVPGPDELPTLGEALAGITSDGPRFAAMPRPLDMRWVNGSPWAGEPDGDATKNPVWLRTDGVLPDDDVLHVCVLAYASDLTLIDAAVVPHGLRAWHDTVQTASLDHAMWFHAPFRADDWLLYDTASPSASGARGLATGRFFTRDGRLIATTVQEGLIRVLGR